MTATDPGTAVPISEETEWFKWRNGYLHGRQDPSYEETFARGVWVGKRCAVQSMTHWAGIVPVLQELLTLLKDLGAE